MIIYSTIFRSDQWEDFNEAVYEGLNWADASDIFEEALKSNHFSYSKLVALIAEHMPDLYDDAIHSYLKEYWVSELYTDEEDEDELTALKDEAGF